MAVCHGQSQRVTRWHHVAVKPKAKSRWKLKEVINIPEGPALETQRPDYEFETSFDCIARPSLKHT